MQNLTAEEIDILNKFRLARAKQEKKVDNAPITVVFENVDSDEIDAMKKFLEDRRRQMSKSVKVVINPPVYYSIYCNYNGNYSPYFVCSYKKREDALIFLEKVKAISSCVPSEYSMEITEEFHEEN